MPRAFLQFCRMKLALLDVFRATTRSPLIHDATDGKPETRNPNYELSKALTPAVWKTCKYMCIHKCMCTQLHLYIHLQGYIHNATHLPG